MYCLRQKPPDYTQYRNVYQKNPSAGLFKLQDQVMALISQKAFWVVIKLRSGFKDSKGLQFKYTKKGFQGKIYCCHLTGPDM